MTEYPIKSKGRPSAFDDMMKPDVTADILKKIADGCADYEIYKALHTSALTFRKWRDANIKAYDDAKELARSNMLSLAESALQAKMKRHTLVETETVYEADMKTVKLHRVKTKEIDPDTNASMFVARAGNPQLYDPVNFAKIKEAEVGASELREAIEATKRYDLNNYETPDGIEAPVDF